MAQPILFCKMKTEDLINYTTYMITVYAISYIAYLLMKLATSKGVVHTHAPPYDTARIILRSAR